MEQNTFQVPRIVIVRDAASVDVANGAALSAAATAAAPGAVVVELDSSRSPTESLALPPGRVDLVLFLFSVIQPRSLIRANADCDSCLHLAGTAVAFVACDVSRLGWDSVVATHAAAGMPRLTADRVSDYVCAKHDSSVRAGLPRRMAIFLFDSDLSTMRSWITDVAVSNVRSLDAPGCEHAARFREEWDALESRGRQSMQERRTLSEWIVLRAGVSQDGKSVRAYFNRRTRQATWTMPRSLALSGLQSLDASDELRAHFLRVASASKVVPAYVVPKAMTQLRTLRAAGKSRADLTPPPSVSPAPPITARCLRKAHLEDECESLRQQASQLRFEEEARRREVRDLESQLLEQASTSDDLNAEEGRIATEIQEVRAKITQLEAMRAQTNLMSSRIESWSAERAAVTAEYVAAWQANQATRKLAKNLMKETAAIREEVSRQKSSTLKSINARIDFLSSRVADAEREIDFAMGPGLTALHREIAQLSVDLDVAERASTWSGMRSDSACSIAARVQHRETADVVHRLQILLRAFSAALDELCVVADESCATEARRLRFMTQCQLQLEREATTVCIPLFVQDRLLRRAVVMDCEIAKIMHEESVGRQQIFYAHRSTIRMSLIALFARVYNTADSAVHVAISKWAQL